MNPKILEQYKKMQGKFRLPQLVDLKNAFKIEINDEEKVFDQIRNEISEKLFTFTERIIEPIIGGSEAFCCMFEQDMIDENERKGLFELYKKIQVLKWENNLLILKSDEKQTAKWIKKTWNLWNNELENELMRICRKFSVSWKYMTLKDEKTNYHG